jgi:hypothetical protein
MMYRQRPKRGIVALAAVSMALLAGCASDITAPAAADISVFSGAGQRGFTGLTLGSPLVALVTNSDGDPVAGVVVEFTVTSGSATVNPAEDVTGSDGLASTTVTIGDAAGPVQITAAVRESPLSTTFAVTVQPLGADLECSSESAIALQVGEVRTSLAGEGLCLRSDQASKYVVNAFFASTVTSAMTQVGIAGFDITTGSSAASAAAASSSSIAPAAISGIDRQTTDPSLRGLPPAGPLDRRFREFERSIPATRMAGARQAMHEERARRATTAAAPLAVGDLIKLNGADGGCNTRVDRVGRVAAITNHAIVVSDTTNPAGGFTDSEFQSIAVTFDTLVDPLDRAAFGDPTDIDQNGHVILFYSRVVNEMTDAGSDAIIEGFFNPRDLFPKTSTAEFEGCAASNFAEMFYLIVPDPAGTIHGNVRTKDEVKKITISVIGHEYQHLINAARRLYVNDTEDFEEVWLNEGLSHIAEELLFYRVSGLAPRADIDADLITGSQKLVDAFNEYQSSNFGRYELFLDNPTTSAPYSDNDSLATRGAIWSFLRYAADRRATTDGTIWFQLVNSPTVGLANLRNVFSSDILDWFRDWSMSVYTDDLAQAIPDAFTQPSWDFRSIYPRLGVDKYPLAVTKLVDGVDTVATLAGGGSWYAEFGARAGALSAIAWSVSSSNVKISVARVR